jgi:hypothetical protein
MRAEVVYGRLNKLGDQGEESSTREGGPVRACNPSVPQFLGYQITFKIRILSMNGCNYHTTTLPGVDRTYDAFEN